MRILQRTLWSCLGLVLLALAGCRGEGKFEERPLGYVGEARRDPFLALGKLLESWGGDQHVYVATLDQADEYGTVIVRRETLNDAMQVEAVRELLRNETHVIVLMSDGEVFINDWTRDYWGALMSEVEEFDDTPLMELFAEAGIRVEYGGYSSESSDAREIRFEGEKYVVDMPVSWGLGDDPVDDEDDELIESDQSEGELMPMISREYAAGRLTVLASAKPLRNRFIADHDHAALYHALWDASGYYGTAVVKGKGISFFALVWERAWMVVVAVGVWLLLWLWFMMKRRSAPVEPLPQALTSYRERIQNTASFLWERGATDSILAAIKRAVVDRWRITTGESIEYPAMPDPGKVAARLGGAVSVEEISTAFFFAELDDAQGLRQTIEVLQAVHREL